MQVALLRGMKASGRLLVLVQALTSPKLAAVDEAAGTIPAPLQVNDFCQYPGESLSDLYGRMSLDAECDGELCWESGEADDVCRRMRGWPWGSSAWWMRPLPRSACRSLCRSWAAPPMQPCVSQIRAPLSAHSANECPRQDLEVAITHSMVLQD